MNIKEIVGKIDSGVNHLDLETQYIGFRVAYFLDLFIASLFILTGQLQTGLIIAILGVGFGIISNQKLQIKKLNELSEKK